MNKELGFLMGFTASAVTFLAVGILIYGIAVVFTGPVIFIALAVGFVINTWFLFFGKGDACLLPCLIHTPYRVASVLLILLAWTPLFLLFLIPEYQSCGSILSGDFFGGAFSVALATISAALLHRRVK